MLPNAQDTFCQYQASSAHVYMCRNLDSLPVTEQYSTVLLPAAGHVDAGKSTLMGHLLYLLGNVSKRVMHKYVSLLLCYCSVWNVCQL